MLVARGGPSRQAPGRGKKLGVGRVDDHRLWLHAGGSVDLESPQVMAIVNLTPDSFFDGGHLVPEGASSANVAMALRRCATLRGEGAVILDLGGESTRPGAAPVSPELEAQRVVPVIARLAAMATGAAISVDTRRAAVAAAAVAAGAMIVNDVSGLADPAMVEVVAASGAGLVIGHMRGEPATMQQGIAFQDVIVEVAAELASAVERAIAGGISRRHIIVDPGIGFGKTPAQSAALVAAGDDLRRETGCEVMIGASRKSFLGALTRLPVGEREAASVVAALLAVEHGARLLRVHDVAATVAALQVAGSIRAAYRQARRGSDVTG
jgi:dihydropteroate synthase